MPHLSFEYSAGVEQWADMTAFAAALRDAMLDTGVFPLGGVRVRGHRADIAIVADGGAHDFVDISIRLGAGREDAVKAAAAETIYAAAEAFLKPLAAKRSFALSLEMRELDPALSLRRYNTIHAHLRKASKA
ncbi:MAG: 5-carboxymethyl-2-hydroxymuconate isomerase [Paracoccaceae bacterium]